MLIVGLLAGCGDEDPAAPGGNGVEAAGGGAEAGVGEGGDAGDGEAAPGGEGEAGTPDPDDPPGPGAGEGEGEVDAPAAPFGCGSPVVINEILYDPEGNEGQGLAFVELKGEAGGDLSGWELVRLQSDGARAADAIALTGPIPAGGYYVIGESATVQGGAAADFVSAEVDGAKTTHAFQLFCGGTLVDAVAYGPWAAASPGEGAPAVGAAAEGESLSRCPDGADSGDNGADLRGSPATPGLANDRCPLPACDAATPTPAAGDLVINEIGVQRVTVGATEFPEFVEIVNVSGGSLDLSHQRVRWNPLAGGDFNTDLPLPGGTCLQAEEVLLIWGGENADWPNDPGVVGVHHPNAMIRNGDGEVQVVSQAGDTLATLCYGTAGCGFDPVTASVALDPDLNTGSPASPHDVAWFSRGKAASPGSCQGGGAFADGCESLAGPSECPAAPPGGVVINEVGFAPEAGDAEFVELFNDGAAALDLSGWILADGVGPKATFEAGTTLAAGKALVVLDANPCPAPSPFEPDVVLVCVNDLGLNNDGEVVTLSAGVGGAEIDRVELGPAVSTPPCHRRSKGGVSFARHPDGGGVWAPHTLHPDRRADSPGLRLDRTPF